MGKMAFIIGESGTGKSTSIRTLDPDTTYIINICDKELPWKGSASQYKIKSEKFTGNLAPVYTPSEVISVINKVNKERPYVKTLIIEDFGYIISKFVGENAAIKGYDKFSILGHEISKILEEIKKVRSDLYTFITWHTELAEDGKYKMKLFGKMIENHIKPEGMVSMVLHTSVTDGQYRFLTQNDGLHLAKSPMGLFESKYIPNDLSLIIEKMNEYYNQDIEQ